MSLFALNKFTKKQNKKWGFKLDTTDVKEDEAEMEEGEKAAKEGDEQSLEDVFKFYAGDDMVLTNTELLDILNLVASDPTSGIPQEMIMPVVEFVGIALNDFSECSLDWEMDFDQFKTIVEVMSGGE